MTLQHKLSLLFSIIQVKPFIALSKILDISGLWLNPHVVLLFCLELRKHVKNDSPSKAVTYGMGLLSAIKINDLYSWQPHN